jgi:hypothetical protein
MHVQRQQGTTPPCSTTTWHKLAFPVGHPTGNNASNCAHVCTFVLIFAHFPTVELNWRSHVQRQQGTTPPCSTTTWRKLALPVSHPTGNNASNCAHFCTFVLNYSFLRTPPQWSYPILLGCDHAFSLLEVRHGRLTIIQQRTNKKINYWPLRYALATLLLDVH